MIEIREWDTGDWWEVRVDGEKVHEGHRIPVSVFEDVLRRAGCEVAWVVVNGDEE